MREEQKQEAPQVLLVTQFPYQHARGQPALTTRGCLQALLSAPCWPTTCQLYPL